MRSVAESSCASPAHRRGLWRSPEIEAGCVRCWLGEVAAERVVARGPQAWTRATSVDGSGEYCEVFTECGRGESDTGSLLAYYGVPLLLATDGGFIALTTEDQVVAAAQQQIDGMRAAAYDHSDILASDVTVLNATSALYRQEFSRPRADGDEISRSTATYLVTDGSAGRRISALVLHSP